jgi:polyhydroxyalkanoate synthase
MDTHNKADEKLGERTSREILGPNPFIGFRGEDILATAGALAREAASHPTLLLEQQANLVREVTQVLAGQSELKPDPKDKRFQDDAWTDNPFYRVYLGGYLAWTKSLNDFIDKTTFDAKTKEQARFVTGLMTDALSPSNSILNPSALKRALDTGGKSVVDGLRNMMSDVMNNGGMPSMVDKSAFKIGENIVLSKGSVIFRNDVLELIQYNTLANEIFERPMLFVPPQINKFYMLDIEPNKSMVRFLSMFGFECFAISWRNPTKEHRDWNLDTYIAALDEAVKVVQEVSGSEKINMQASCSGAMTAAALLGYYAAIGNDAVESASLAVAVLDADAESTLGLFASKEAVKAAKASSAKNGVMDGQDMGRIFAWLRPNDLVWNYWVNNYLLGKDPPAFDVLYWNADTTRLPAAFHADLMDMYIENKFKHPGALTVLGHPVDMSQVTMDKYFIAGITDHITPWKGVYSTMHMFGGYNEFILSAAGHIQSLINPPYPGTKRTYFVNPENVESPDAWLEAATNVKGSWWTNWIQWVGKRSGGKRPAPAELGNAKFPPIVKAPGTYVFE